MRPFLLGLLKGASKLVILYNDMFIVINIKLMICRLTVKMNVVCIALTLPVKY